MLIADPLRRDVSNLVCLKFDLNINYTIEQTDFIM